MPNIHIDFTANLADEVASARLVEVLHAAAVGLDQFPTWGIRVFATPVDAFAVGDGSPDNGFVQVVIASRPGANRPCAAASPRPCSPR